MAKHEFTRTPPDTEGYYYLTDGVETMEIVEITRAAYANKLEVNYPGNDQTDYVERDDDYLWMGPIDLPNIPGGKE